MLNDGDVTFYTVEMNGYGGTRWHGVGDPVWAKVPSSIRHAGCERYSGKEAEPFHSYSASGKIWQATGFHGWEDVGPAMEAMMILARYNPDTEFRVVRERHLRAREQIGQIKLSKAAA